jgi:SNF2 family DNA or RNA helicase
MGSGLKQFGVSFEKTLNGIRNGGRNPTYRFLREMLEVAKKVGADLGSAYKAVEVVVTNHFFYDPIVSITEGEEPVMDLEVDHPRHSFVADGFVNHNTLQCIASLCYLWEKTPTLKALVFTSKSAVEQWGGEFDRFTTGVKSFICRGNPNQRRKVREAFQAYSGPSVLVMGYSSAKQDIAELQDWEGFALILDEATAFKNHQTRTHQVCKYLAGRASRAWALTATLIKNNLLEGWGIYQVLVPTLFGNMNSFMNEYCVVRMMPIPGSRRQIPTIVGYRPKDVQAFREKIDPYFLGRPKFEVASELPPLITRHVKVDLTKFQEDEA